MLLTKDPQLYVWNRDIYTPEIEQKPDVIDSCHTKYGKDLSKAYDSAYQKIMKGNACEYVDRIQEKWLTREQCETLLDGYAKQGLLSLLTEYHSVAVEYNDLFGYLVTSCPASEYPAAASALANNPRLMGLQMLFRGLVYPLLLWLKDLFISSVADNINQYIWTLFICMIIYVCSLVIYQVVVISFVIMENHRVSCSLTVLA
jgi:hypothetical protein